ncbi:MULTISPECIES: EbsA family protein [unclassified Enterococcus]|uniref:EbsA family protein n=1 Tax=unclassified Enterococcus TaxID=2608891 RepID=UPI001CE1342B|nr:MULTISPECIES: EbsA family protein [unclassified Enterococcus]MCA5012914.1 EbsA family protein [Enterococcus sp. S23]MCA5016165.1 EbsA family protein [Enterococcus sp. S22(2020)]
MKKRVYHWQPELSTTIIYWSCTFGILFLSLILMLEHTRPYLVSNIVLGVFFFFALLGLNRYFILKADQLIIHALLPIRRRKIKVQTIEAIFVGPKSIKIISSEFKEGSQLYIMTKKTKAAFISQIETMLPDHVLIHEDPNQKAVKQ